MKLTTIHLPGMALNSTHGQLYLTGVTTQEQWKVQNLLVSWVIPNTLAPAPFNTSSQNFRKYFVSLTTPIFIESNGCLFTFVMKSRFSSDQPAGRRWFVTGLQMFSCKYNGKDKLWYDFHYSFALSHTNTKHYIYIPLWGLDQEISDQSCELPLKWKVITVW